MSSSSSNKKRGEYKKQYSKNDILLAVTAHRESVRSSRPTSISRIATRYNIPHQTLRDAIRKAASAIQHAPPYSVPSEVVESAVTTSRAGVHNLLR